jgi:hypothetical protein
MNGSKDQAQVRGAVYQRGGGVTVKELPERLDTTTT